MSKIEEIRQSAKEIKLAKTTEFLSRLYSKTSYTIVSKYPTINTIACELEKGDRCFKYSSGEILPEGPPVKFQNKSYGYQEPFILENDEGRLNAFQGAAAITLNLGKGFTSNGELWELETNGFNSQSIYRAIVPLPNFNKKPMEYIKSLPFKIGTSLRVAGLIHLMIKEKPFDIFDYKINDKHCLIIDSKYNIDQNEFENIVSSILYCFGLISGCLIRGEIIIVGYEDIDKEIILGFHFRRIEESINGIPSIDPKLYREANRSKNPTPYISSDFFSNMINKSLNDLRLFRSIRIITESFKYPLEIRASTFSVALETLKNIIIEENEEKINPFKSKKTASQAIQKLKSVINEIDSSDFNNKQAVLNKLEQLNQVGNRDSFLLSFKLLEISLNEDDINCINMRNDFLHGRVPYENEPNDKKVNDFQLQHIVYKFHLLTTSLIFKYCGYSGYMLNNIKLVDLLHFKKNIKEPLFRQI